MRRRTTAISVLLVLLAASWAPRAAKANIEYFVLEGIAAVGTVTLDDRIGKARDETEHVINIEDCEAYLGQRIEISWSMSQTPLAEDRYTIKVSEPGGSCPTDDLEDGADEDGCHSVYDKRTKVSATTNTFEVELDALIGGNCGAGTDEVATVYVVYEYGDTDTVDNQPIDFTVDLKAPALPTNVEAIPGESSITVAWDDDANTEDGVKYRVYYRADGSFSSKDAADGSTTSGSEASSATVTGLESNTTYYFRVAAVDPNDNEGPLSADTNVFTTTVPSSDFWEHYKDEGGDDPGGFCFIATAAYGTPLSSSVNLLREFRDRVLVPSALGRDFVALYYRISPPIARVVYENAWLAALVRIALLPLLFAAWFLLKLGWAGKLAVILGFWTLARFFRATRERRYRVGGPMMRALPLAQDAAPAEEEATPC